MKASALLDYNRATVEVTYHLPDFPHLLQTFSTQIDDKVRGVGPKVREFLDFWQHNIEGPIHSVRVGNGRLISRGELRHLNQEFKLN